MKRYIKQFVTVFITVLVSSCASKKDVLYLQDIETYKTTDLSGKNEIRLKKNDEITINVSSSDKKSAVPFNLPLVSNSNNNEISQNQSIQSYLIDEDGNIQFPVIGKIYIRGLTKTELNEVLTKRIEKYVKSPIINIRITNFSVSVIGEVRKPGMYKVNNERITVIDALSLAGDLTIYGNRKEILIIRENDDYEKSHIKIDITKSDFLNTDYYYLEQNDVVMISPNNAQVQSSVFNRNTPFYVSIASLLLSVLTIFAFN